MTPKDIAAKHEGRFRLDVLNIALAAKLEKEGDLQEAIEILLLDILAFGREIHQARS